MAYSLQALKDLIKNSPSVKELPVQYQKKILKTLKSENIAEKRELYFILLNEKQQAEKINERFESSVQQIYGQFNAGLNYLTKKYKIN